MDSPCIKQTVCKILKGFEHGKYFVLCVLKGVYANISFSGHRETTKFVRTTSAVADLISMVMEKQPSLFGLQVRLHI